MQENDSPVGAPSPSPVKRVSCPIQPHDMHLNAERELLAHVGKVNHSVYESKPAGSVRIDEAHREGGEIVFSLGEYPNGFGHLAVAPEPADFSVLFGG